MEEQEIQIAPQAPVKRPQMLTILCIITFIGSGLYAFSYLVLAASYDQMMKLLREFYKDMPEFDFILSAPREFFIISFILSAFSILGAVFMWNLRKMGFHFYTSAQIFSLALPAIYFGNDANPFINIMVAALFVYLYARNLRFMH
jgi:hypothetical protein